MFHKLQVSIVIVIAMFCLGGCLSSGGGSGDGSSVSSLTGSSGSSSVLSTIPSLGIVSSSTQPPPAVSTAPITVGHNPEPLTIALFGSGLLGYALLRRRKNKK